MRADCALMPDFLFDLRRDQLFLRAGEPFGAPWIVIQIEEGDNAEHHGG